MTDAFRGFDHVQVSLGVRSQPPTRCHRVFDQQVRASFVDAGQMFGVTLLKNFFFFGCRCFAQSLNGHTATTTTTAFLGEKKDKQKVKRNTRHSQQITEAENTGRRIPLRIQLFSLIICFLFCQSHFLPSLPNATPVVATVVPPSGAGGQKVEKRSNVCGFISCFSAAVYVFFLFILPTEKKTE
jgi:hypothetical protein